MKKPGNYMNAVVIARVRSSKLHDTCQTEAFGTILITYPKTLIYFAKSNSKICLGKRESERKRGK